MSREQTEEEENGYWVYITPLVRYKLASWLIRVWASEDVLSPHLAEHSVMLERRIDRYQRISSRGAETRRGRKYRKRSNESL